MENGEQPINPTWMTQSGESTYTALKQGQKTGYEKQEFMKEVKGC